MAGLWVDTDEGRSGRMPARCVRTGERCITRTPLPATDLHPVIEWLTWSGLWPRSRRHPGDAVVVSLLPGRIRLLMALRQVRDLTALLLVPALVGALVSDTVFATRLLQAVLAVKLVVAVAGLAWAPRARLDTSGAWVRLDRIRSSVADLATRRLTQPEVVPELAPPLALRQAARHHQVTDERA